MKTPARTSRPCGWCGCATLNEDAVCANCVTTDRHANDKPTENDALTDGAWRFDPFKRVQVWVPTPAPIQILQDPAAIACGKCHVRADQTCRTKHDRRTADHKERVIPRCCPCGAALGWKRQVCDDCLVHTQRQGLRRRRRQAAEAEWAA